MRGRGGEAPAAGAQARAGAQAQAAGASAVSASNWRGLHTSAPRRRRDVVSATASARWRGGPHAFISTQAPAPKKKKKSDVLVALALALDYGNQATLVLRCLGKKNRRWDGSRPISKAYLPEVACGYPIGTHEKKVGNCMFRDRTPSAEGIYTLDKINYKPIKRGQHHEKTGEKVYWRLVEESDVEAIKEAFELDY